MYVVAIAELGGSVDAEAAALAAEGGTTAYEERLNLIAGLPAVVLTSPDAARAQQRLDRVQRRGHGALIVDAAAVVPSSVMVEARRFRLEADALCAGDPADSRLPWSEVTVLVRAVHRTLTASGAIRERKFSVGRALATGGLITSKTTVRQASSTRQEQEHVLYLFRRRGATPWILRETGTFYTALGSAVAPSSLQNFVATIAALRDRAPGAIYDERLTAVRRVPERLARAVSGAGQSTALSSESGIDLLAHLVAAWLGQRARAAPFR